MIDLRPQDHEALAALVRAGRAGIQLARVGCSAALMLGLCGLAEITTETPQRVIVTRQGAAFARRTVL